MPGKLPGDVLDLREESLRSSDEAVNSVPLFGHPVHLDLRDPSAVIVTVNHMALPHMAVPIRPRDDKTALGG